MLRSAPILVPFKLNRSIFDNEERHRRLTFQVIIDAEPSLSIYRPPVSWFLARARQWQRLVSGLHHVCNAPKYAWNLGLVGKGTHSDAGVHEPCPDCPHRVPLRFTKRCLLGFRMRESIAPKYERDKKNAQLQLIQN